MQHMLHTTMHTPIHATYVTHYYAYTHTCNICYTLVCIHPYMQHMLHTTMHTPIHAAYVYYTPTLTHTVSLQCYSLHTTT